MKLAPLVNAQPGWNELSGNLRPRGVRLDRVDRALVAVESCGPDRAEPFRRHYDRAIKAIGLS